MRNSGELRASLPRATQNSHPITPLKESEYVDRRRACCILGISPRTLDRLTRSGWIEWVNYRKFSWKRIRYQSLVDYCDRLRASYRIADRRPQLSAPYLRHRDEDLLPFPLSDTMGAKEALSALGFSCTDSLVEMIEEGLIEAYQLVPQGPWRISRRSLLDLIKKSRTPSVLDDPARYSVRLDSMASRL